jgi:hypothetical protein
MALNCHCRDCQRATGSAYASGLFVPAAALSFSNGEPKYHVTTADSGNVVSRGFCVECGSPVVAKQQSVYPVYIIHASTLDEPSGHRPTMDVFTSSAQPWDHMHPDLPKYPRGLGEA